MDDDEKMLENDDLEEGREDADEDDGRVLDDEKLETEDGNEEADEKLEDEDEWDEEEDGGGGEILEEEKLEGVELEDGELGSDDAEEGNEEREEEEREDCEDLQSASVWQALTPGPMTLTHFAPLHAICMAAEDDECELLSIVRLVELELLNPELLAELDALVLVTDWFDAAEALLA